MKKRILTMTVGTILAMSTLAFAATSSATISNSQSSATGNYIYTGNSSVTATVSATCGSTTNAIIQADAMKVIEYWADASLQTVKATTGKTVKSSAFNVSTLNNAYYVKLSQKGSVKGNGSGNFSW